MTNDIIVATWNTFDPKSYNTIIGFDSKEDCDKFKKSITTNQRLLNKIQKVFKSYETNMSNPRSLLASIDLIMQERV